jgi:hypothetical protein
VCTAFERGRDSKAVRRFAVRHFGGVPLLSILLVLDLALLLLDLGLSLGKISIHCNLLGNQLLIRRSPIPMVGIRAWPGTCADPLGLYPSDPLHVRKVRLLRVLHLGRHLPGQNLLESQFVLRCPFNGIAAFPFDLVVKLLDSVLLQLERFGQFRQLTIVNERYFATATAATATATATDNVAAVGAAPSTTTVIDAAVACTAAWAAAAAAAVADTSDKSTVAAHAAAARREWVWNCGLVRSATTAGRRNWFHPTAKCSL